MRQAEEKYRTILEEMEDAYFEVDLEGNYIFVNDQYCRAMGYSREEMIGMNSRAVTHEEDYEYMLNAFSQAYQAGESIRSLAYRMVGKDREIGWVEVSAVPLRNQQGEIIGFRGIGHNITERKQAEERIEELLKSEKELRRSLEDEMKRRVGFTRALVHELKTPLVPIVAASELLTDEVHEEESLSLVRSIQKGASTMNIRIDTLHDLARGELGMLKLKYDQVNPLSLLHNVAEDMHSVAAKRGFSLFLDVPSSLPPIWADESRLEQVVQSLLMNGAHKEDKSP